MPWILWISLSFSHKSLMAVRILHDWIIHPTSLCMSFLPRPCSHLTSPSCRMFQIQNMDYTWHWCHWHWHDIPRAHSEWLCPHTSTSPGPPAQQDTDSWQRDISFYLHYYKGHSLALWSWLCGSRWIGEAPRHSSGCCFGDAGCSPH